MTTIVRAANAAQFLSLVPRMLEFRPRSSLVLVPFAGDRSLGVMRFDLPEADFEARERVASTVIGMVCRLREADALAAIAYTDAPFRHQEQDDLLRAIERRADSCGLRLNDALTVAADGWGSLFDPLCPESGRPLDEIEARDAAGDPMPDDDQASGARLPDATADEKALVKRAVKALGKAVELLCGSGGVGAGAAADSPRLDPMALAAACRLDDLPMLFEGALEWDAATLDPFDAALIAWCLARPSLRDIALVQWTGGMDAGDRALDAQLKWESGEEYPVHLARIMWGEGDRPDPRRLERALALTRHVAAAVPRKTRAGALATAGWLSWALGRSTHASVYATQACEAEPEHGLGEIVRSFVHVGHVPDWAFRTP